MLGGRKSRVVKRRVGKSKRHVGKSKRRIGKSKRRVGKSKRRVHNSRRRTKSRNNKLGHAGFDIEYLNWGKKYFEYQVVKNYEDIDPLFVLEIGKLIMNEKRLKDIGLNQSKLQKDLTSKVPDKDKISKMLDYRKIQTEILKDFKDNN